MIPRFPERTTRFGNENALHPCAGDFIASRLSFLAGLFQEFHEDATAKERGMKPTKLTAAEVKRRMDRGERFAFVDVRSLKEWKESDSRLPGAIRIASDEIEQHLQDVPQGRTIIAYCDSPNEESCTKVALELMRRGFMNVHPLIGGLDAWRQAGGPIEPK